MQKNLKYIFSSLIFLIILFASVLFINSILTQKLEHLNEPTARKQQLDFLEKDDIDTLYLGGSRVTRGINPITIWEETGLQGVNLATLTQPPLVTKYLTLSYVEKFEPEYIFLDPSGIQSSGSIADSETVRYRGGINFLPSGNDKISVLKELKKDYPEDNLLEYYFPLYRDHGRWNELRKSDFVYENDYKSFHLGIVNELVRHENSVSIEDREYSNEYSDDFDVDEISLKHYQELVDELKRKDIEIFIIVMPDLYDSTKSSAYIDFATKNGLNFIDLSSNEYFELIGLETEDLFDDSHLTYSGAVKASKFLGQILANEWGIDRPKNNELFNTYWEEYIEYNNGKYFETYY